MTARCTLHMPEQVAEQIFHHLFPGDDREHELVLLAGLAHIGDELRLLVREVVPAREGLDCGVGKYGHRTVKAHFIQPLVRRAREERKVFLSVHNHGGTDSVSFSVDDWQAHERGYPALLDLADGMPVGAIVFAQNAAAGDIWLPDGRRLQIDETRVVGSNVVKMYDSPKKRPFDRTHDEFHDRQTLMFGRKGQEELRTAHVGIIGVGGVGSLLVEYLSRLGVGTLSIVDPDRIEPSNLSRVVGATRWDTRYPFSNSAAPKWIRQLALRRATRKVDIAKRVALTANPGCQIHTISDDFAKDSIARQLLGCDFLFLAADSMRARLVFNAVVQQYFIPGFQIGTRIESHQGIDTNAYSVVRWVLPGRNCLWCSGMISPHQLAVEAKTEVEVRDQAYGSSVPNPSVLTMNAVGASHAVNDFLFSYLGLFHAGVKADPMRWKHFDRQVVYAKYPPDQACLECGSTEKSRFGQGDSLGLPTVF